MANIDLPEKEVFNQRVRAVQGRIEGITKSNTMAGLLNNNFKKWLSSSSMSPLKLTQELDNNSDGVISGDEFATLLGKMTGERPPEWVVELVFSFVDADVNRGIPLDDWMAFLAASGMEIPDEMFKKKVVVAGSIAIDHKKFETGQTVSVSVSFNVEVVAYEFAVVNQKDMREVHSSLTPNVDTDRPDFDEFEIELDDPGTYVAELRHLSGSGWTRRRLRWSRLTWSPWSSRRFIRTLRSSMRRLTIHPLLFQPPRVLRASLPGLKRSNSEARHRHSSGRRRPLRLTATFNRCPEPYSVRATTETVTPFTVRAAMGVLSGSC